jgi:hypothetical protein
MFLARRLGRWRQWGPAEAIVPMDMRGGVQRLDERPRTATRHRDIGAPD